VTTEQRRTCHRPAFTSPFRTLSANVSGPGAGKRTDDVSSGLRANMAIPGLSLRRRRHAHRLRPWGRLTFATSEFELTIADSHPAGRNPRVQSQGHNWEHGRGFRLKLVAPSRGLISTSSVWGSPGHARRGAHVRRYRRFSGAVASPLVSAVRDSFMLHPPTNASVAKGAQPDLERRHRTSRLEQDSASRSTLAFSGSSLAGGAAG